MDERCNGQNDCGDDRPADHEREDVPVPPDLLDHSMAHVTPCGHKLDKGQCQDDDQDKSRRLDR